MYKNIIETKNLILLTPNLNHAEGAYNNIFKHEETSKFMLWKPDGSVTDTALRIERWTEAYKNEICYFIFKKEDIKNPVGFVFAVRQNETTFADIGLCLGKQFAGCGYGYEVMSALINYFKLLGVKKVIYSCFTENVASNKLALKLGFKLTEVKERFVIKYNKSMPENYYELQI